MNKVISVELLERILDSLVELRGEWYWKKDSIPKNERAYRMICEEIEAIERIIKYEN